MKSHASEPIFKWAHTALHCIPQESGPFIVLETQSSQLPIHMTSIRLQPFSQKHSQMRISHHKLSIKLKQSIATPKCLTPRVGTFGTATTTSRPKAHLASSFQGRLFIEQQPDIAINGSDFPGSRDIGCLCCWTTRLRNVNVNTASLHL